MKTPSVDDTHILNIIYGITGAQAMYLAHDLLLFEKLHTQAMRLEEICQFLQISPRAAQALLPLLVSLQLLDHSKEGKYSLTTISEDYLIKESSTYFGGILDLGLQNSEIFSMESFKQAILSDRPQIYAGEELFATNEIDIERAKTFTRTMHSKSMASATSWPEIIDLSRSSTLLDIGGGSGAHSIGALLHWSHLKAIIYDRPFVCEVAQEFIAQYTLEDRIHLHTGDMWNDALCDADIHFYSDIFHDWPQDKCLFLAQKSFNALPPGGKIILHEMLFTDDKTAPYTVAAYNMKMLQWTEGQQFSGQELTSLLENAGFHNVRIDATGFGLWSLITADKP